MTLLRTVFGMARQQGWHVVNLDCVVCCEQPKLFPYREQIRLNLASALNLPIEAVFVKGKTGEGLGPVGKGIAVEAEAVCLLERP
jgi:2-C-methyl-D-erythritol 2,4-cyclodiphosphate synthase